MKLTRNISGASDFIYTDNPLKASVEVAVPLRVGLEGLGLQDTLDISLEQDVTANGYIVLVAENYFPFSAELKLTLLEDENYPQEIILNGGYISPGYESFTGVVLNPSVSTIRIPFTTELLERLREENRSLLHSFYCASLFLVRLLKRLPIGCWIKREVGRRMAA